MRSTSLLAICLAIPVALLACGDNNGDDTPADPDAPVTPDPQAVSIQFAAKVGGTAFACGQTYSNIGTASSDYVGSDFRFYIHDLAVVTVGGDVPVELDANEFQAQGVALLDFEDATANCQMGTTAKHEAVTGTIPGDLVVTGIKLKVGLPFDLNHLDAATAAPPLNIPAMFWAWSAGYKFLKADGVVGGNGFNLHLGSTGCDTTGTTPATTCANPNIMEISFSSYALGTSVIVADIASVLSAVDVSVNTANTAPGCMSFPNDPECDTVFPKLGLAYGANAAGTQALFSLQ